MTPEDKATPANTKPERRWGLLDDLIGKFADTLAELDYDPSEGGDIDAICCALHDADNALAAERTSEPTTETQTFEQWADEHAETLSAEVIVLRCETCQAEFTDWRGEEARDAAVKAYLATQTEPTAEAGERTFDAAIESATAEIMRQFNPEPDAEDHDIIADILRNHFASLQQRIAELDAEKARALVLYERGLRAAREEWERRDVRIAELEQELGR